MKTLLKILTSTTLLTSAVGGSLTNLTSHSQSENRAANMTERNISDEIIVNENVKHNSIIIKETNFSEKINIPSGTKEWTAVKNGKVISLINYKQYANNWEEFTDKYHTLKLLNFYSLIEIHGSYETSKDYYELNTKNIKFNQEEKIINDSTTSNAVIMFSRAYCSATISFSFFKSGHELMLYIRIITSAKSTWNRVWAELHFTDVIFLSN